MRTLITFKFLYIPLISFNLLYTPLFSSIAFAQTTTPPATPSATIYQLEDGTSNVPTTFDVAAVGQDGTSENSPAIYSWSSFLPMIRSNPKPLKLSLI